LTLQQQALFKGFSYNASEKNSPRESPKNSPNLITKNQDRKLRGLSVSSTRPVQPPFVPKEENDITTTFVKSFQRSEKSVKKTLSLSFGELSKDVPTTRQEVMQKHDSYWKFQPTPQDLEDDESEEESSDSDTSDSEEEFHFKLEKKPIIFKNRTTDKMQRVASLSFVG